MFFSRGERKELEETWTEVELSKDQRRRSLSEEIAGLRPERLLAFLPTNISRIALRIAVAWRH